MTEPEEGHAALKELVRTSTTSGVPRRALLLRTDWLPPALSSPEQLRRVRETLMPLNAADRVQWYDLPGGRLGVSWKGDAARLVTTAQAELSRFLQEQPLDAPPLSKLMSTYELPLEGDALIEAARADLLIESSKQQPAAVERQPPKLRPFTTAELDRLEQHLAGTDVSRFARRRPISQYAPGGTCLAWEERTLSIPELIETVAPGRDPKSDVWLFRRLTRVLDRRLLAILSDGKELAAAGPFSITLNVASVLSPEFLRFDAALPLALRNRVMISFLPGDVASDAGAFAFARNFARGRSFRTGLRAVSASLLPALDLQALDMDFVQLIWSPELAQMSELPQSGNARWIVGQPCCRQALEWGVKQGVSLFATKPTS